MTLRVVPCVPLSRCMMPAGQNARTLRGYPQEVPRLSTGRQGSVGCKDRYRHLSTGYPQAKCLILLGFLDLSTGYSHVIHSPGRPGRPGLALYVLDIAQESRVIHRLYRQPGRVARRPCLQLVDSRHRQSSTGYAQDAHSLSTGSSQAFHRAPRPSWPALAPVGGLRGRASARTAHRTLYNILNLT